MSEELTLLPCPARGHPAGIARANGTGCAFVMCQHVKCAFSGPIKTTSEAAVAAWNALPRALEWTTEPQLGAWNWWRDENSRIPRYVYQDGTVDIAMQIDRVPYQKLGGQWAGPIPEPRPHEQEKNNV